MISVFHSYGNIRTLRGKRLQRAAKLIAGIAAQIADRQACMIAARNSCRFGAHPLIIRRQHQTLLIEILPPPPSA